MKSQLEKESFSKTYSRPILIRWKYLQVTSLSQGPHEVLCLHHTAPHHWGLPEKNHQSLAHCQFMIITINRVLLTTHFKPISPHLLGSLGVNIKFTLLVSFRVLLLLFFSPLPKVMNSWILVLASLPSDTNRLLSPIPDEDGRPEKSRCDHPNKIKQHTAVWELNLLNSFS